jgi:hypothetical protein
MTKTFKALMVSNLVLAVILTGSILKSKWQDQQVQNRLKSASSDMQKMGAMDINDGKRLWQIISQYESGRDGSEDDVDFLLKSLDKPSPEQYAQGAKRVYVLNALSIGCKVYTKERKQKVISYLAKWLSAIGVRQMDEPELIVLLNLFKFEEGKRTLLALGQFRNDPRKRVSQLYSEVMK